MEGAQNTFIVLAHYCGVFSSGASNSAQRCVAFIVNVATLVLDELPER